MYRPSPKPELDPAIVVFHMYQCIQPDGSEIILPRPMTCACGMNHERLVLEPIENTTPYKDAFTYHFVCPVTGVGRIVGFSGE